MTTIFPGNYVAHLNAYRDQSVFALPGIKYFQVRGAAVLEENLESAGTLELKILSPDLRQDDKPRLDKPFIVPEGATIYRSALTAVNLTSTDSATLSVDGTATNSSATEASLAADGDGVFPSEGAASVFAMSATLTAETGDTTITVEASSSLSIVDPGDQAAVIVEVCYFIADDGPDPDDVHLPYKVEAGSGY